MGGWGGGGERSILLGFFAVVGDLISLFVDGTVNRRG
jgi:hypothetical protein